MTIQQIQWSNRGRVRDRFFLFIVIILHILKERWVRTRARSRWGQLKLLNRYQNFTIGIEEKKR